MDTLALLMRETLNLFRPPKRQTVSEWADKNRVLVSESSAEPGPWKTDRAPYQREIMDAFTQPGVWQIVMMSSAQVGKSEIELNMMGCAIDNDPGPILYMQPTDSMAEDYSKRRIAPMISGCPSLRQKVNKAKGRDAANTITMKTFPGGSLAIVGANSPAELSSKPVKYIFMDETDRFPASAGTEGDPQELAERRTETFRHNRKIVKTSTPTLKGASRIEKDYLMGTQEEWHTECPHCRQYSFIRFEDICFSKEDIIGRDGEKDFIVRSATWRCPLCKRESDEHTIKRQPGRWVVHQPKALENGIRSFRLNAFMSPWSDWKEIVLKFLRAKDDPKLLQVFYNTMLGESWEIRNRSGLAEKLYGRREHYNAEVPTGVLLLTMGVDVQDNRMEYEIVGWSRTGESWGINYGVIPGRADAPGVWRELDRLLDEEWHTASGVSLRILATFMDSGGHFTEVVYKECAKRGVRRLWAIKGEGGDKPLCRPMKKSEDKALRFILGVDAGKEGIMYEASIAEPGPRYMHFPMDTRSGYTEEYFKGLFAEQMVFRKRQGQSVLTWEKVYERNEPLDCRNYARTAFRYFHWHFDEMEALLSGEAAASVTRERKRHKAVVSRGINL